MPLYAPRIQLDASMYVDNSGAPTHTSVSAFQKVGGGGGTATYVQSWDVRSDGSAAQVDAVNKRINISRTGLYSVFYCATFTSLVTDTIYASSAYVNGVQRHSAQSRISLTGATVFPSATILSLVAGDYVELWAYQADSASEAYLMNFANYNFLTTSYIGPSS